MASKLSGIPIGIEVQSLQPACDAYQSDNIFKQKVQQKVGVELVMQVRDTKEQIEMQLQDMQKQICNTGEEIEHAVEAQSKWQRARLKGSRKSGRRFQNFVTRFANFLTAYSGIVELVQMTGCPYASVAYGTLSLLLIVVVNKTGNDKNIAKALEELQTSFPRLNILRELYPEPKILTLVTEAYWDMIKFARSAVIYYTETSKRLIAATVPPQEHYFNNSIENLRHRLVEINSESALLLHGRAKYIKDQAEELLKQNNILQEKVERLEAQNNVLQSKLDHMQKDSEEKQVQRDQKELVELRESLGVPEACDHTNLESCKHYLKGAFPVIVGSKPGKLAARYSQMSPGVLDKEKSYRDWLNSSDSCLLLFSGKTVTEGRTDRSTYSWLSPAAIYVAESQHAKKSPVAFHCCHPQHVAVKRPVQEAILSLVYQVVAWKPDILRRNSRFQMLARKGDWKGENEDMTFKMLSDLLTEVNSKEPVYIILDRADQCRYLASKLMAKLVEVIQRARCNVKMMVVMDSTGWTFESLDCEDLKKTSNGCMVGRLGWDQQRLGPQDLVDLRS